jgi:hypothetical protein
MSRLTPLPHLRREAPGGRADQRRRASDGRRHVLCSEYFPWITLSRNGVHSPDALRRRRGAGDRW